MKKGTTMRHVHNSSLASHAPPLLIQKLFSILLYVLLDYGGIKRVESQKGNRKVGRQLVIQNILLQQEEFTTLSQFIKEDVLVCSALQKKKKERNHTFRDLLQVCLIHCFAGIQNLGGNSCVVLAAVIAVFLYVCLELQEHTTILAN